MRKVAVAALVVAAIGQVLVTFLESGYNTAAGLAVAIVLLGMAGLAATGRWWALGAVALLSGLLTIAAIGQVTERVNDGETGELVGVFVFQALTLTAAVAGTIAAVRGYRRGRSS